MFAMTERIMTQWSGTQATMKPSSILDYLFYLVSTWIFDNIVMNLLDP